jgi:hypothetical protein
MNLTDKDVEELELLWKYELKDGKENADPRTYEKRFSIDDITKALQGVHNPTFDVQRLLFILQNK